MSSPNDSSSSARAAAPAPDASTGGTTGARAAVSTTPCTTQTVCRRTLSGSGARSHGHTRPAATKIYRASPMARIQGPACPARTTRTASTSSSRASTSMSNRAPKREATPRRRASRPSTPSSMSPSEASATAAHAAAGSPGAPNIRPASRLTSMARTSVTTLAGPKRACGACRRSPASTPAHTPAKQARAPAAS